MAIELQVYQFNKRLQNRQMRGADGKPVVVMSKVVDIQFRSPLGPFVIQAAPVELFPGVDVGDTVTLEATKAGVVTEIVQD